MKEVAILPEQAPVMPLPGGSFFRMHYCRFTFSNRVTARCSRTLSPRANVLRRPAPARTTEWKEENDFSDVATIGFIRACGRGDGISTLILQGLQRVCFIRCSCIRFPSLK